MAKKAKQASGGARLKAAGRHPVLIGVEPDGLDLLRRAASLDGRPLTQFFLYHTLAAAKRILRDSEKNP